MDKIAFKDGQFIVSAEQAKEIQRLVVEALESEKPEAHQMVATTILGPLQTYAAYESWLEGVLMPQTRDFQDNIKIAKDQKSVIAFSTSPTGAPLYTRPGRSYTDVGYEFYDVGLQMGFYDAKLFGWPVMEKKIKEKGEEMARKRDTIRKAALDTAVEALSGHTATVATTMTKASIDAILKLAAAAGYTITNVRINPSRIMDMTSWAWPSDSMWRNLGADKAEQVFRQGFVTGYGGARWQTGLQVPVNYIYLFAEPSKIGWEWSFVDHPKTWTQRDINTKSDYYLYIDACGVYCIANGVWRLQIT